MELKELMELADGVEVARFKELCARRLLIDVAESLEIVKAIALSGAYKDGTIDGKNAEVRKQQEAAFLAAHENVIQATISVAKAQDDADSTVATLAGVEARYGLVKAWLYSQAKIG